MRHVEPFEAASILLHLLENVMNLGHGHLRMSIVVFGFADVLTCRRIKRRPSGTVFVRPNAMCRDMRSLTPSHGTVVMSFQRIAKLYMKHKVKLGHAVVMVKLG